MTPAHPTRDWRNEPDHSTPIDAVALEEMEERAYGYADSVFGVIPISRSVGADVPIAIGDVGGEIIVGSTSARQITVPPHSSVPFPLNAVVYIARANTGTVTMVEGSGAVTFHAPLELRQIANRYGEIKVWQKAIDEWWLSGVLG